VAQNCAPGAVSAPQLGQVAASDVPQVAQKRAPASASALQEGQITVTKQL